MIRFIEQVYHKNTTGLIPKPMIGRYPQVLRYLANTTTAATLSLITSLHPAYFAAMKLLTYNIHYWEGTDGVTDVQRTIDVIRSSGADVIALNEVFHPALIQGVEGPALAYMAGQLGMSFVFGQAHHFSQAAGRPGRSFGNALLSRWPILASAAHHLTSIADRENRGLLEARVLLPDGQRSLTFYVTHLDHEWEDVRLTQTQALLSWTSRDRNRPHVLMGDLNTINPADYAEPARAQFQAEHGYEPKVLPRLLKAGYVDAWTQAGSGPGETCCNPPAPLFRIDYLLLPAPLAASLRSCQRWEAEPASVASDHLPVLAELNL